MLTVQQAAAKLHMHPRAVAHQIRHGNIQAVKFGRQWSIDESEVERYAKERNPVGRPSMNIKLMHETSDRMTRYADKMAPKVAAKTGGDENEIWTWLREGDSDDSTLAQLVKLWKEYQEQQ